VAPTRHREPPLGGEAIQGREHRAATLDCFVAKRLLAMTGVLRSQAMIQTSYDPEADVLRLRFGPEAASYVGATEVAPGVFVEFDAEGNAINVEVLSVKLRAAGAYGR
jgi:uncharacterized protein YuzE